MRVVIRSVTAQVQVTAPLRSPRATPARIDHPDVHGLEAGADALVSGRGATSIRPAPNRAGATGLSSPSAGGQPFLAAGSPGGAGSPLPRGLQGTFGARLGRDLSGVRVHADAAAATAASHMGADAFTVGDHIYFGAGRYDPASSGGLGLLGHELGHVEQFYRGEVPGSGPMFGVFSRIGSFLSRAVSSLRPAARKKAAPGSRRVADVFVGFMDEEVADVLVALRNQFRGKRPVVVVERAEGNQLEQGDLFERSLGYYGGAPTRGGTLGDSLSQSLQESVGSGDSLRDLVAEGAKSKTVREDGSINTKLEVLTFEDSGDAQNPVILLRTPEMGMQPTLARAYLERALTGIKKAIGGGDLRVHSFGAGGAVAKGIKPGDRSRMVGSLFVGWEVSAEGAKKGYRACIRLGSMQWGSITFHEGEPKATTDEAANEVRETFKGGGKGCGHLKAKDGPTPGKTLDQHIERLLRSDGMPDNATVSMTTAFIGGEEEKSAGQQIGGKGNRLGQTGLSDVNTEDYHVIVAARAAGVSADGISVERINADPSFIPEDVQEAVRGSCRTLRMDATAYEAAILWGLENMLPEQAPDQAHWAILDPAKHADLMVPTERKDGQTASGRKHGTATVMQNMFFGEIASDFLATALKGKALDNFKKRVSRGHPCAGPLLQAIDVRGKQVTTIARQIKATFKKQEYERCRGWIANLVERMRSLHFDASHPVTLAAREHIARGPSSPAAREALTRVVHEDGLGAAAAAKAELAAAELTPPLVPGKSGWVFPMLDGGEAGGLKVWVRGNKKTTDATLDEMRLTPDDIDRALYKGGNRPALLKQSPEYVENQLKKIAAGLAMRSTRTPLARLEHPLVQRLEAGADAIIAARSATSVRAAPGRPGATGLSSPAAGGAAFLTTGAPSGGTPLSRDLQQRLGGHLGRDLSGVRIHTDGAAATAASRMGADAFTLGSHVYFGAGRFDPGSTQGLGLLGHELGHVEQFYRGDVPGTRPMSGMLSRIGDFLSRLFGRGKPAPAAPQQPAPPKAPPTPSVADVYLGFMDEEVNDILRLLRQKYPKRPVIAIERNQGRVEGYLFERKISYYGNDLEGTGKFKSATTGGEGSGSGSLHDRLVGALGESLDADTLSQSLAAGKPKTMGKDGKLDPTLYVAQFDALEEGAQADPVFLVRAPELGLQPDMIRAYLEPILGSIKDEVKAPLALHVFGAGGAVGKKIEAGSLSQIVGSVFIGCRRVQGATGGYQGVIALSTTDQDTLFFYVGPTHFADATSSDPKQESALRARAEGEARALFREKKGDLHRVDGTGNPVGGDQTLTQAVDAAIARLSSDTLAATVSMTVSFFGGGEDKAAGQVVGTEGLSDVNMEDFHVFALARALGIKPEAITLERLNCDPNHVAQEVVEHVRDWAREARLSPDDYVAALRWGLAGTLLDEMPASGHWTAFDKLSEEERKKLVVGHNGKVVNPYYTEIAVDLLAEAKKGVAFKHYQDHLLAVLTQVGAPPEVLAYVKQFVAAKLELVAQKAAAVLEKGEGVDPGLIRDFVEATLCLKVPQNGALREFLDTLAPDKLAALNAQVGAWRDGSSWRLGLLGDERGQMHFWARGGKFKASEAPRLDLVLGSEYSDPKRLEGLLDDVDRALYKSTNRPALVRDAPGFIERQIKLPIARASLSPGDRGVPGMATLELAAERAGASVARVGRAAPRASSPSFALAAPRSLSLGGRPMRSMFSPAGGDGVGAGLQGLLRSSHGTPLEGGSRSLLEGHFGHDLSRVKVHTDATAASAARQLGAKAFTLGEDIYFGSGFYAPHTAEGRGLLGHETAHVVQGYQGLLGGAQFSRGSGGLALGASQSVESFAESHERRLREGCGRRSDGHSVIEDVAIHGDLGDARAAVERIAREAVGRAEQSMDTGPRRTARVDTVSVAAAVDPHDPDAAIDKLAERIVREIKRTLEARGPAQGQGHVAHRAAADTAIVTDDYKQKVAAFKGVAPEEVDQFHSALFPTIDHRPLIEGVLQAHPELTRAEAEIIYGYTTKLFYRDLNRALKSGSPPPTAADLARSLKAAIAKMPQASPVQYRGLRLASEEEEAEFDAKYVEGATVTSDQFWSSSPEPSTGYVGPRDLIIHTKSARDISELAFGVHFHDKLPTPKPKYAAETIIPPGVKFRVVRVERRFDETGKLVSATVTLKELDE